MRHYIAVIRFKTNLFFGTDESYIKMVLSIVGFELGFIAERMITSL